MTAMTTTFRNRFFLKGILFGGLFGILAGTVMAYQISTSRVDTVKGTMVGWLRRNKRTVDYRNLYV